MNVIISNVMDYGKRSISFIFMFQAFCCEIIVILMELIYLSFKLGALTSICMGFSEFSHV